MHLRRETDARLVDELRAIQERFGFLPEGELHALSQRTLTPLYRLEGLLSFFPHFQRHPVGRVVRVCTDIACRLRAPELLAAAREGLGPTVRVEPCSCLGQCDRAAAVLVDGRPITGLDERSVGAALRGDGARVAAAQATGHSYQIDPYDGGGGYEALRMVLADTERTWVAAGLAASGLRGMGGAGFGTAAKWEAVCSVDADEKFVICNADESEPGTFKDRLLLERFPDLLVEGIAIAAAVLGARRAYIYIRHEYEAQRVAVEAAMARFAASPFAGDVAVETFVSPGGYICGEESALLEAMEGKRAEPRNKPPFPATCGLWGKPTLINNVETLCWIPSILLRGPQWFADQGVNGAKGVKFIALSGHVERPGVYEVPLGTRAADLIDRQGGGVSGGRRLKALSPGGPSSGVLPGAMADVPLDFDSLQKAGSMLGSGAVVAFAEGTCMLDVALNFLRFFRNESCGKCVPCRVGTQKLVDIAEQLAAGRQAADDDAIADLATTMNLASICGLGQVAPAPLLSVLKYFAPEVASHRGGRCPLGVAHE